MRYAVKRLRFALPALGGRPAITYAAFRSSSTAIHHAVRAAGIGVSVKAHMLAPENLLERMCERGHFASHHPKLPRSCHVGDWAVRRGVIEPKREADFVIPVRDPWAVAHSCFVLSAEPMDPVFSPARVGVAVGLGDAAVEALVRRAEELIFGAFPRDLMLRWLREDVHPALAWDPIAQPFDAERGFHEYAHGPWRIEIVRVDLSDERKSDALRSFFGRPSIAITPKNQALALRNTSSDVASIARRAIARRPDAVRALLEDPACRHFWCDEDRERMWRKWTGAA